MASAVDLHRLAGLVEDLGDLEFAVMTVELYLSELPGRRRRLVAGLSEGEDSDCREWAHSLGSASALVGAMELSEACRTIERAGIGGFGGAAGSQEFSALCARAEQELASWVADQGSKR